MKKIIWLISFLVIILLATLGYFLYVKNKSQTFQSHFEVLAINYGGKSLKLKYILPDKYKDKEITTSINCSPSDIYVFYTHSTKPFDVNDFKDEIENTPPEERLQKITSILDTFESNNLVEKQLVTDNIYAIAQKGDILRGVCKNLNCTVINKQCELYKSI